MTRLAHISDVHFGREDSDLVDGLLLALAEAKPDAIVVSGDLTQRARKGQFRKARAFLAELPKVPTLIVPGNHDVSATNLIDRMARPLKRYRQYIANDLTPFLQVDGLAIAGISTVRRLERKDGRINRRQVALACGQLGETQENTVRVVVTHHPIDLPLQDRENATIARAKMAIKAFSDCHVDLFLSGHLHAGQAMVTSTREAGVPYAAVVAHAGTAVSTRTRIEPNGWNLIDLDGRQRMTVQQMRWSVEAGRFVHGPHAGFARGDRGWMAS
ncbi:3',5'-cyclic AMP phosphodiesterase CpdA [Granulicella pectinivorans]|jgi:3',5'-cyclic AMP phosphodiesterase CpdA|uniref:3',5'-cyclic AMP phosphodiesterase CpdA n=1 Tax=Granulicella pectinivorans TaxID=474950 RepID=A0A1I6LAY1_9BACT|nr:metallophosphoesterase family protein [Granulicella pectinivorans]SFS00599.1 3',5'-cyclic AMP phosphodiesterase CpdA [Granulicella pectinivorans]